jgi:hypothetical protein
MELALKRRSEFTRFLKIGVPGFALFLSIAYVGVVYTGRSLVQQQSAVPGLDDFVSSAGFLAYIYLPIAPLVFLGLQQTSNAELKNWTAVLLGLALSTLIPFAGFVVTSYRWSLLLDIPICVYASSGVARLLAAHPPTIRWFSVIQGKIIPLFSLILIASAALYIAVPAQNAILYYTAFPGLLPTSMIQDTVPASDMPSLMMTLDWVQANMHSGTVLITHQAIYGWARAYLPADVNIVNYRYSNPLEGVKMAGSDGYSSILMIWWVNGTGWHGQQNVPSGFVPLTTDGSMAVYAYY